MQLEGQHCGDPASLSITVSSPSRLAAHPSEGGAFAPLACFVAEVRKGQGEVQIV